ADVAADDGLFCPMCGASDCAEVPAELRPQWARDVDTTHAALAWLMRDVVTTYDQARRRRREQQDQVRSIERREWLDSLWALGQSWDADIRALERGELLLEGDSLPEPRAVFIPLPELPIERAADDCEPDGADEVTSWL